MDVRFGFILVFVLLLQTVDAKLKKSSLTKIEDVLESVFFGRRKLSEFHKLNPLSNKGMNKIMIMIGALLLCKLAFHLCQKNISFAPLTISHWRQKRNLSFAPILQENTCKN